MSVFGDIMGVGSNLHLPAWKPLDLQTEQNKSIAGNKAAQPGAAALANLTEQQIIQMMQTADPNFASIRAQESGNILDASKGKIPKDVQDLISNKTNAEALGSGMGASGGYKSDLVARDLGITSLDRMDKSLGMAESWMASSENLLSPAIHLYDSMFVTPEQQASFSKGERDSQFAHDYLGEQISSEPPKDSPIGLIGGIAGALSSGRGSNTGGTGQGPQTGGGPNTTDITWDNSGTQDFFDQGSGGAAAGADAGAAETAAMSSTGGG